MGSPEDVSHEGRLSGDFYTGDEVFRSAMPQNWCEGGLESCKPYDLSFPLFPEKRIDEGNFEPKMQTVEAIVEFEQGTCAPEVPTDVYFKLEETNMEVNDMTAEKLGNRLIDIFRKEYSMHITKTSLRKYSIIAESTSPTWFALKVRIYSKGPSHIVEFQRRKGDTVAFNQFFQKVMGWLNGSYEMEVVCDFTTPHPIRETASIQPFIDMANNCSDPSLLSESVSGFCAVEKEQCVPELCTREGFTALESMRTGGCNVFHPLAQVLSELAIQTIAIPFFADRKFWEALLDVVTGDGTCGELKTQFARVVLSALDFGATNNQIDVLQTALKAKGVSEQIWQMLEKAACMADLS